MRRAVKQLQVVLLLLPLQDLEGLPPRVGIKGMVVLGTRQEKRLCTSMC